MDAECEIVALKDQVFPPGEDVARGLAEEPLDTDLAVPGNLEDRMAGKRLQLFGCEIQGRPFHVTGVSVQKERLQMRRL
jgi:hypothetical protein